MLSTAAEKRLKFALKLPEDASEAEMLAEIDGLRVEATDRTRFLDFAFDSRFDHLPAEIQARAPRRAVMREMHRQDPDAAWEVLSTDWRTAL